MKDAVRLQGNSKAPRGGEFAGFLERVPPVTRTPTSEERQEMERGGRPETKGSGGVVVGGRDAGSRGDMGSRKSVRFAGATVGDATVGDATVGGATTPGGEERRGGGSRGGGSRS
jgi:hypothetical protein